MTGARLSFVQRIARFLLPARAFAALEAGTRPWVLQCPACGFSRSLWELGGIRYKASGTPRHPARCHGCGKTGWHRIVRTDGA